MKSKTTLATLAIAATVSAMTIGAFARGPISLTDDDGDGVISAEEIRSQFEAQRAEQLALFDTDGDGALSESEKEAMREAHQAERLATADANGDGELSRAEQRAARDTRRDAIEAQLDVDGDGVVSDAEGAGFDELHEERHENRGRGHGPEKHRGGERNNS